jgi:hypothetical protein
MSENYNKKTPRNVHLDTASCIQLALDKMKLLAVLLNLHVEIIDNKKHNGAADIAELISA